MKKHFVFLPFLLFAFSANAQNQIVEPWKMWANLHEYCHSNGTEYSTDYIRFEGDTTIDDITYKKVWQSEDENHENWLFYGFFIREENQKVYLRRPFEEEGLCYDFTLQQTGDTVSIVNPLVTAPLLLTLTEIDSVETADGWRERWKLTAQGYETPEYWIKGIGSMSGVLNSGTAVFGGLCGSATLLCEHEFDTLVYQNPDYGSCYIVTTGIKEKNQTPVIKSVMLNSQSLRLALGETGQYRIRIVSLRGQTVAETLVNGNRWNYPKQKLPHGLLFVTVIAGNKTETRKIFVP